MRKHPLLAFAASTLGLSLGASLFGAYGATATPRITKTTSGPKIEAQARHRPLYWKRHMRHVAHSQLAGLFPEEGPSGFVLPHTVSANLVAKRSNTNLVWMKLRTCESGDNYRDNSGNGFYGAYQFTIGSWYAVGETGMPDTAAPAVQDAAARRLLALQGWNAWPTCTWMLGLT